MKKTLWLLLFALTACDDMKHQPKFRPLDPSPFFSDGRSARTPVAGTVARGDLRADEALYTGKRNGKEVEIFPFPLTTAIMERGRERHDIFCAACHGRTGDGQGMVVKRGFPPPPAYQSEGLKKAAVGHLFNVITHGSGIMYSFSERIPVKDRWAIVAYVRALQLGQDALISELPPEDQAALKKIP